MARDFVIVFLTDLERDMKRLESIADEMRGTVTYELPDGRWVTFGARAVREYGIAELMRSEGLEQFIPTERLPVIRNGRRIGTMAPDFDPSNIKSTSPFYDPRAGDFRREGDAWIADRTLGAGDPDCVVGFVRDGD